MPRWLSAATIEPASNELLLLNSIDMELAPMVKQEIETLIRPLFPPFILSYVQDSSEGQARVETSVLFEETAAAQAVIMYRFGWDESDPIHVQIGDSAFDVTVRCSSGRCEAFVETAAVRLTETL